MTTRARARLKSYQRQNEEARKRFTAEIKALTPEQKKEILVQAGVLTSQGKFTSYYRTSRRRRVTAKAA
jgi:hypothetical protein